MSRDISSEAGIRIDLDDIDHLWYEFANDKTLLPRMKENKKYYDGNHAILNRTEAQSTYADGTDKAAVVTNWIRYIIRRYLGAISDFQVTLSMGAENPEEQKEALKNYSRVLQDQRVEVQDAENLRNALLMGYGVEVHGFVDNKIVITNYDPREWAFIRDDNGDLVLAIRNVTFSEGAIYNGQYLDETVSFLTIYSRTHQMSFYRSPASSTVWTESEISQHNYGRVPVVEWRINEESSPLISAAMLTQNDEYNKTDSANGDAIYREVDAMLKLNGVGSDYVKENAETIRALKVIPLDEGQDAAYLHRQHDIETVETRLQRTRRHIHMMAAIPDVQEIIGSTGKTSGIALKLMYSPMEHTVQEMSKYLRDSLKDRVELLNSVWEKLRMPQLIDYDSKVQFLMPVNRVEEWQNIPNLKGIVSHRKMLEILSDVEDPEQELQDVREESPDTVIPEEPGALANARDARAFANPASTENIAGQATGVIGAIAEALESYLGEDRIARLINAREGEETGT